MEEQLAQALIRLREVHNELVKYSNHRVEHLKNQLVNANDIDTVKKIQGSIQEVERLIHLKDVIAQTIDRGNRS